MIHHTSGKILLVALCLLLSWPGQAAAHDGDDTAAARILDPTAALNHSQAAVGRSLDDFSFLDLEGQRRRLSDFRGKPLVVSVVFTACTQSCPLILQRLADAVGVARDALGDDSFAVAIVGLDPEVDTPQRLASYARSQGVGLAAWHFLGTDHGTIEGLVDNLGFTYVPSARGFDHIAQISIIDSRGVLASHVYGDDFSSPALVEPLKAAIFNDLAPLANLSEMIERIRLFCTFYDPKRDSYYFDYSFFIALAVGFASLAGLAVILIRGWFGGGPRAGTS